MIDGVTPSIPRWLSAAVASAALVAAITTVIALLEPDVPALGLGVLYLLAVVPVALVYGTIAAGAVSLTSVAAFTWFCLPPKYSLSPGSSERWSVLAAFLVSSLVVSELAARSRHEARRSARLADEQAALRRVATLVARGVPPPEVFAAVAREVGRLLDVDATHMARYEPDETATGVAAWSPAGDAVAVGTRVDLEGESVVGSVFRTHRPVRMHDYGEAAGATATLGRELGLRSSVGAPIVVDQRLWGVMIASAKADRELPADAESRIAAFTGLVATAISNTEARTEMARLADEQAALRRVATLIAQGAPSGVLFACVTDEAGPLLGADLAAMARFEPDHTLTVVSTWAAAGEHPDRGARRPMQEGDLATRISTTGRPARTDGEDGVPESIAAVRRQLGIRSSVAGPIVVEGIAWGGLIVHSRAAEPLPADTESRLMRFAELVATAMSNAEARAEVQRLADEQAALRRVATLVAHEASQEAVLAAVAQELGGLMLVAGTRVIRYDDDATTTLVASWGEQDVPVGTRVTREDDAIGALVRRTGRPARIDDYSPVTGSLAAAIRELGFRSAIGSPILIEGRLWGAMLAVSRQPEPLPAGTEERIAEFTELIGTAIANVQAREDLAASRARIVAATDDERRRVVRDLHDGAQQRLVHTILTLKLAEQAHRRDPAEAAQLVGEALEQAQRANEELRELSHGILPSVLTSGGLRAGVRALASRMPVPVQIKVSVDRLPATVEATAYFVVAEALTNVAKHANATHGTVRAHLEGDTLKLEVGDDGIGGARADGHGLVGLADRLAVLDGRLRIESPADGGTLVTAAIPLPE
jgi:signal transduction histidine kinase